MYTATLTLMVVLSVGMTEIILPDFTLPQDSLIDCLDAAEEEANRIVIQDPNMVVLSYGCERQEND